MIRPVPDYAIERTYKYSMHSRSALSMKLIVTMELFLIGSGFYSS
jgi:hypothetical protein